MANWKNPQKLPDGLEFIMVGPSISLKTVLRILWIWMQSSLLSILLVLFTVIGVGLLVKDFNLILPFLPFLGMAWSDPTTRNTGDIITSAIWNQDVVDNPQYLKDTLDALELNDLQDATADYAMGGNLITGLGAPVADNTATQKIYVDQMGARAAYNSGWFAAAGGGTTYTKAHGIGATPSHVVLWHSAVAAPGAGDEIVQVNAVTDAAESNNEGPIGADGTNIYVTTGGAWGGAGEVVDSTRRESDTGYYRILAWE